MTSLRLLVQYHAEEHLKRDDPFGWCEQVYREANGDELAIPWAYLRPNPHLVRWSRESGWDGEGKCALVVGCGLGDDAEFLAKQGFDVTAFDISPTAIAWCHRRFPRSKVHYEVADLFKAPERYRDAFDLVVEAYTLQCFKPPLRSKAAAPLASFLAPYGALWLITRKREPDEEVYGPPWPLTHGELDALRREGLKQVSLEDFVEPSDEGPKRRYQGVYRR